MKRSGIRMIPVLDLGGKIQFAIETLSPLIIGEIAQARTALITERGRNRHSTMVGRDHHLRTTVLLGIRIVTGEINNLAQLATTFEITFEGI